MLYCTYVRPKLEYCSAVWSPHNEEDIEKIESVQRNATKLIPNIKSLHYADRLKAIGILSLRHRRLRGDLIQFFKIQNGINIVNWSNPTLLRSALNTSGPASNVRGPLHGIKRQVIRQCDPRHYFLTNRIVPLWNALPTEVINSATTNQFKNKLDSFLKNNSTFLATFN